MRIRRMGIHRLSVYRSCKHIYAQVFSADGAKVLASASSLDRDIRGKTGKAAKNNTQLAEKVGSLIATRARKAGITKVAFDRGGYKYHGRVKALASTAREGGLVF